MPADKVLDLVRLVVDSMYVPAGVRVLRRIGMLCEVYDEAPDQDENVVIIPVTREDIASLAGVTRPTVNRVLQKEHRNGTLSITRGAITLLDKYRYLGLIR